MPSPHSDIDVISARLEKLEQLVKSIVEALAKAGIQPGGPQGADQAGAAPGQGAQGQAGY